MQKNNIYIYIFKSIQIDTWGASGNTFQPGGHCQPEDSLDEAVGASFHGEHASVSEMCWTSFLCLQSTCYITFIFGTCYTCYFFIFKTSNWLGQGKGISG